MISRSSSGRSDGVHRRRVLCPLCGPKLERIDWLEKHQRCTVRLAQSVARLCKVASIKHVAEHYGPGWDRVKRIDKAYLNRTLGPIDLSRVRELGMDEFAIQKGHRYATVIVDLPRKQVLWIGRGRGREGIFALSLNFLERKAVGELKPWPWI